jgi:WD40 repeat protein
VACRDWAVGVCSGLPDGSKIATGGYDKYAVKVCDSTTGELPRVSALVLHSHNHHGVSPPGITLAPLGYATPPHGKRLPFLRVTAAASISSLYFAMTASWQGTTLLWNLDTNLQVSSPLEGSKVDLRNEIFSSMQCPAFAADGTRLVTGCGSNACTWDIHAILRDAGHEDLLYVPNMSVKIHSSISLTTGLSTLQASVCITS